MKKLFQILLAIIICQSAGAVGSFFTVSSIDSWYAALNKPFFNPPNWLFGPVWLLLYTLMGIAAYLIWQQGWQQKRIKTALVLFSGHLLLNALWSIVFFGWQQIGLALINIILLWLSIGLVIMFFQEIDRRAAWLLVPYFLWVSFAAVLNAAILILN